MSAEHTDGATGAERALPAWLAGLCGRPGVVLAALWGAAEATFFFVVPDVLFTLVALLRPQRSWRHVGVALLAAVVAGGGMYAWAAHHPDAARRGVAGVPKVGAAMLERTEQRLDEQGLRALFDRPLGGVPFKAYAVLAPERLSLPAFLALSVPMRLERFLLSWVLFGGLGLAFARRSRPGRRAWLGFHAVFWSVVYVIYWFLL